MKIKVCVGSSCHLKGAPAVIAEFQKILKTYNKKGVVLELEACFCQGCCQEGVVVLIDDKKYTKVTPDMIPSMLEKGEYNG